MLLIKWPNLNTLQQIVQIRRHGSLINIKPSVVEVVGNQIYTGSEKKENVTMSYEVDNFLFNNETANIS